MWISKVLGTLACIGWLGCGANRIPVVREARSACELITASEASEITGSPVAATEASRHASSSVCSYKSRHAEFQLNVQWTGGRSAWENQQRAVALGGKLIGADRGGAAAGVMRTEAAPIGDKASYNPILGAYVLKGDVLLEFNGLVTLPDARLKWEKLARTALSKVHD